MRKLGYRVDMSGYFVPQYTNGNNEWVDFKVKDLGKSEMLMIARSLGEKRKWDILFHYSPRKNEKEEDMSLVFKNIIRVGAFLGAFKSLWSNENTKEII